MLVNTAIPKLKTAIYSTFGICCALDGRLYMYDLAETHILMRTLFSSQFSGAKAVCVRAVHNDLPQGEQILCANGEKSTLMLCRLHHIYAPHTHRKGFFLLGI